MNRPSPASVVGSLTALALFAWSAGPVLARGAGVSGILDLGYERGVGAEGPRNTVSLDMRLRALAGERLAACLGVDGRAGYGGEGASYAASVYPLGVGLRYGRTSQVALCGGVGLQGSSGDAPFSWTVPVELHWEATGAFRVMRPLLVARVGHLLDADVPEGGTALLPFVDELHLAIGLRVMVPGQPLAELLTGDGIFLGLTYDEALGAHRIGVAFGYALAAHH